MVIITWSLEKGNCWSKCFLCFCCELHSNVQPIESSTVLSVVNVLMQMMPGFIKGLTAADIPGTNDFRPLATAEPVSLLVYGLLWLANGSCVCLCVQVLVSDICEYAGQAVAIVVAGPSYTHVERYMYYEGC